MMELRLGVVWNVILFFSPPSNGSESNSDDSALSPRRPLGEGEGGGGGGDKEADDISD